ncbi:YceI family protein [Pseudomonas sp. 6D_7.1_Bac1]|jgi:polyisoprenoid-binding protein YceI|uniref:YceI family protein n=1 Tax=Pseudomonas sp. 6D_7.1_Bac1 TaxID=2971615 RepID=UPI0021C95ED1|nr:YceI family protein [Pseudomonas sp. 6D_7.1_Bac1]MCU1752696.1 YceI family protein [Pseudomonas sp. 6D_7.1_Bac1]
MSYRYPHSIALAAVLTFGTLAGAQAVEYKQVNATASQISFTYNQMGARVYGTFGKFEATIDFDSANPAAAHAALTIQLNSIDAGSRDANSELQKPAWFNTAAYPEAKFVSSSVTALGNNRYEVKGKLTLKGVTREVGAQITLKPQSAIGVFDGEFILKRGDFKIGEGEWADYGVISNEINIKFRVVAPEQ